MVKEKNQKKKNQKKKKQKKKKSKKDDSSSSSSDWLDSSENIGYKSEVVMTKEPIYYWWYDPHLYKLQKIYVPTFVAPLTPYIEIDLIL